MCCSAAGIFILFLAKFTVRYAAMTVNLTPCNACQMQTKGQGPEALPADLWSAVLSHLPTASRMSARLVCKLFSTFGPRTLCAHMEAPSSRKAQSLMLLLARKANFEGARIHLQFDDLLVVNGAAWTRPCLYASLPCSGLRRLDLDVHVNLIEAASLLELLPAALDALSLYTDAAAVSLQAWSRLTCLDELMLLLDEGTSPGPHKPSGLALLQALAWLSLEMPPGLLAASSFSLPALEHLQFHKDPFGERPDLLHCLPALQTLCFHCTSGHLKLPAWAVGHHDTLQCDSFGALSGVRPTSLLCKKLIFDHHCDHEEFALRFLVEMPNLQSFSVVFPEELGSLPGASLQLKGNQSDYQSCLDKLSISFEGPFNVVAHLCTNEGDCRTYLLPLGVTGHPVSCQCGPCKQL